MFLLFVIMIVIAGLLALVGLLPSDEEPSICDDDIPCQECGRCFNDHPANAFSGHSYTYPRDF